MSDLSVEVCVADLANGSGHYKHIAHPLSKTQLMVAIDHVVTANLSELTRKTVAWMLFQTCGNRAVRLFVPHAEACRLHAVTCGCYEVAPLQGPSRLNSFLTDEKVSMRLSRRIVGHYGQDENVAGTNGWTLWLADKMWEEEAVPLRFDWSVISQVALPLRKKVRRR